MEPKQSTKNIDKCQTSISEKNMEKRKVMQNLVPKIVNSTTILQISSKKTTRLRKINVCMNNEKVQNHSPGNSQDTSLC